MLGACLMFVLLILIYITISDVITVLFRLTGLTEEKARFQVVSLLTNSGFTTHESEIIVSSKVRRKIAKATMIFGYAFTVTIVSTILNIFMSYDASKKVHIGLYLVLGILVVLLFYTVRNTKIVK